MRKWVYAVLLSIVLIGCKTGQPELKNPIVVDTGFVLQDNYYGGAMQWEPNDRDAMTEAQWERLFKRVRYMNLGYIRCCIMPYFYCFGYEGQEPVLIWDMDSTKVDARWYANSRRYMNDLYRQLQFCKDNDIDVLLGEWWKPMNPNWQQAVPVDMPKYTIELDDPRYAASVADMVEHLVKEKGLTCIKQFNLGNEVNLMAGDPKNGYSWGKWKRSILNLRNELDKRGLDNIGIVGPDGGYWGADVWFNKTLNELDSVVSVIDYHWYINKDWTYTNRVEDETRMFRFFTQMQDRDKVNIWGEMGIRDGHDEVFDQHTLIHQWWYGTFVADALIQTLRSGWSAGAAWGMDDAMHYKDNLDEQKRWGFWNSIAEQKNKPKEAEIRPWFYTWSLMSRNIPKGSKILYSNSYRTQNLNCVAALTPSGDLTFAITNTADFAQSVTVQIPTVSNRPTVNKYVYFENDYPVDTDGFPAVKEILKNTDFARGITIDFPAQGFVLLTTKGGTRPEIVGNDKCMVDPMEGIQRMYEHSDNLGMNSFARFYDRCDVAAPDFQFFKVLEDKGTIHPSTNDKSAYVTYKLNGLNYFEIKVSGVETVTDRFKVYASYDNKTWQEVDLNFTEPELSVWRFVHSTITPKTRLTGYNYLKIEMFPKGYFANTRLREVKIVIED